MLDTLRRGATGWVAKILLSVLVLSFAIWGIADTFRNIGHSYLAKVGSRTLSPQEYQSELTLLLNNISAQARRRITADEARQYGLDTRALTQLIGKAALDNHADAMRLSLSDATVADSIKNDQGFKGLDGKFSKSDFEFVLRQMGYTERSYLAVRRHENVRDMLTGTLSAATVAPKAIADMIYAYREEARTIEHFTIDVGKTIKVPEPDDAAIKTAYEQSKSRYVTPEYRALTVLLLPVDIVKKRMNVADDEIKAAYDADPDHYNIPERRHILQIPFKDKAAAAAAKAEIGKGKSFEDVAKEAGAKPGDIDLGVLTKKQMLDPKIADAAFGLQKDTVSDVVEGRFSTVLLKVTDITAGVTKSLADVTSEIKERLAKEKALAEVQKIYKTVDDARAGQKSLIDTGKALDLPVFETSAVSLDNKSEDGKTALDFPDAAAVIKAGFEAQAGVEHDAVEMPDGGFAWVDVKGVTPPQQKPLEAVRDQIKAQIVESETRKALIEASGKMIDKLNAGAPIADVAAEAGGKVETAIKITRETLPQGLTKAAVTQAFALAKDKAGASDSTDGKSRVVFKVVDIIPAAAPTKEQSDKIQAELQNEGLRDTLATYVAGLEERYGVSVDDAVLKRTLGTDRQ